MNYQALKAELTNDPAELGYAGKSDAEAAALLNARTRTGVTPSITGSQLFEAIAPGEYNGLTAEQKANLRAMWAMPTIDITPQSNGRAMLLALFGSQSTTRANIVTLATSSVSRAQEIGLGRVDWQDVHRARNRSN